MKVAVESHVYEIRLLKTVAALEPRSARKA